MPEFDVQPGHVEAAPSFDVQQGHVGEPGPQEEPGFLSKAAQWLTTPSDAMKPIIAENKVNTSPGVIGKDSGDIAAGAAKVVSGIPGFQPHEASPEFDARMAQFDQEHPVLGKVLPLAGGLAKPAVLPTTPSPAGPSRGVMDSIANKLAARMLKGTAGEYKSMSPEQVQELGDFLLRKSAVKFGSSPSGVAANVAKLPEQTGQALGDAIGALDQTGAQVSKKALADRFMGLADEARKQGPGAAPLVAKYENEASAVLKDIESSGQPMMSFKDAENWKRAYQDRVNYGRQNPNAAQMGDEALASNARQGVEDAAQTAGEGSRLGEDFLQAKKESGLAQQAARMAEGAEGRSTARNMVSPAGVGTSLAATSGMLASGHMDPLHLAAAAVSGPAMQVVRERGPAALAVGLKATANATDKIASIVRANPQALGRFAPVLTKALQEGPQSFAANAYALNQVDPDFQALHQKLAEDK